MNISNNLTDAEIIEIIQAYVRAREEIIELQSVIEYLRGKLNDRRNRKKQ